MPEIIRARGLRKRFGELVAVDGIDFAVQQGECFGLLGPNGAGKTSTIRMITCVSPPSGGELEVDGMDVTSEGRKIKNVLGVVSQDENLDPDLSVWQNLAVYARYFDIPAPEAQRRAEEILDLFQLSDRRNDIVDELSGGMKRRLIVARALINRPRILVLDEPTTGLDPQARHLVWRKLKVLQAQGITILLTTHNMEEAAKLCNRLVVMHLGRILSEGTPADLVGRHVGRQVLELHLSVGRGMEALEVVRKREHLRLEEVEDMVYVFSPKEDWGPVLAGLEPFGDGVRLREGTLEDVFLQLTGRGLQE